MSSDERIQAEQIDPAPEAREFLNNLVVDSRPRLCWWRGDYWFYLSGAYRPTSKNEVRAHLVKALNEQYAFVTTRVTSDVLNQVQALAMIPSTIEPNQWIKQIKTDWPANEIIVAKNGLVNLPQLASPGGGNGCIRPLTPRLFSHCALEFPVNPLAPPPLRWLEFLLELWGDDPETIDCLQEVFGYIVGGGTWLQKIFAFIGPKRSGKGTIGRVLRHLVGLSNCAGPTLSGLATNFGLWPLVGKSLATISDARLSGRTDQAIVVERLLSISGEDALTIDRKNLEPITITLPTRILLMSNELPRLGDSSGAMTSRMIMLRFTKSFYGAENHQLTDQLIAELPGILMWSVIGWKRLQERGHIAQPSSAAELLSDLEDLGSPIGAFVRERCTVDPTYRAAISDLFNEWKSWCEAKGRRDAGNEQTFGRDLRAAFPSLNRVQPRDSDGGRYRAYEGIGIRTNGGFEA